MTATLFVSPHIIPAIGADVIFSVGRQGSHVPISGPLAQALSQKGPGTNGRIACHRKVFKISDNCCVAVSGELAAIQNFLKDAKAHISAIEKFDRPARVIANLANDHFGVEALASFVNPHTFDENHCAPTSKQFATECFGRAASAGTGAGFLKKQVDSLNRFMIDTFLLARRSLSDHFSSLDMDGEDVAANVNFNMARIKSRYIFSRIACYFLLRDLNEENMGKEMVRRDFGGYFEYCYYDRTINSWVAPQAHAVMIISFEGDCPTWNIELTMMYDSTDGGAVMQFYRGAINTRSFIGFHERAFSTSQRPFGLSWQPEYIVLAIARRDAGSKHMRLELVEVNEQKPSRILRGMTARGLDVGFPKGWVDAVVNRYIAERDRKGQS